MRGWLNRLLGNDGERVAAKFLRRSGYRILARQHSTSLGEIDLIALDGDCIVFVEVKTRRSSEFGHPAEAVTHTKQQQLTRLALAWLRKHQRLNQPCRFDVVAVIWPQGSRTPEISHYRHAFEATGHGQMFA